MDNWLSNIAEIARDFENMSDENDFFHIISKYTVYNKYDALLYFTTCWDKIPDKYLYELYKEQLSLSECGTLYNDLFSQELIDKIFTLNKDNTIYNKKLVDMLDEKGYLTIYRGHCKKTLRNSNSWTLDKNIADYFGNRNAFFNNSDKYYIVTGRVKLEDVIAFIENRNESEIVVMQKTSKIRQKNILTGKNHVSKYTDFRRIYYMTSENNTVNFDIEQIEYLVNQMKENLNKTKETTQRAFDLSNKLNEITNNVIALKSDIAKLNDIVTAYEQGVSVDSHREYTVNEFKDYVNSNIGKKYSILTLGDGLFDAVLTGTLEYDENLDEFRVVFRDGDFSFDHRIIKNISIYNNGKIEVEFISTVSEMEFTPYC
ncbi:MAG: hypothetical protein LUG24_00490 [Clostridiales bacterium]|nr:hypothetical protein [Clostridiales bacterium]